MKLAFKKQYAYTSPEKYRIFLKQKFTSLTPRYYSVVAAEDVETVEGQMVAMQIVTDEIENPKYEPIAEVWINDEYVYLWRDYCWTTAVDKNNRSICQINDQFSTQAVLGDKRFTIIPAPCNKTMLIHKIGSEPVE